MPASDDQGFDSLGHLSPIFLLDGVRSCSFDMEAGPYFCVRMTAQSLYPVHYSSGTGRPCTPQVRKSSPP
jgi:hypothetical protein